MQSNRMENNSGTRHLKKCSDHGAMDWINSQTTDSQMHLHLYIDQQVLHIWNSNLMWCYSLELILPSQLPLNPSQATPQDTYSPDCFHTHRPIWPNLPSHLIMRCSTMYSVSRQPLSYYLNGRRTLRSTVWPRGENVFTHYKMYLLISSGTLDSPRT